MGVDYVLLRVRSPIGPGGVSVDRVRDLTEGLTLGTPQEVKRRLREANVFDMGTGSPEGSPLEAPVVTAIMESAAGRAALGPVRPAAETREPRCS